jgi:molecular chaperone DnaK
MNNYIGIDLGTTESTVSIIEIKSILDNPMEKLRALNIFQYDKFFQPDKSNNGLQSSLYIDRDQRVIYTGEYAKAQYASGNFPLQTIRSVKTRIGGESMIYVPLKKDPNNRRGFNMTELSAVLLKRIYDSIRDQISGNIENVTITVPAGFNSDERRATLQASHLAGFKNVILLDEPTAVLLNFVNLNSDNLAEFGDAYFESGKNILVYYIGSSTLDISIGRVELNDGDFQLSVLGRSARMDFGGDDIDQYISAYFLNIFEKINKPINQRTPKEQAIIVSRIVSQAEEYKITLSNRIINANNERLKANAKAIVNFEVIDNLYVSDVVLTDKILREILVDVISDHGQLLAPITKTLRSAKLKKDAIDLVVLTGGSGKLYLVEETLKKYFGNNTRIIDFTEREAVSKGASIHSYNQHGEKLKKIAINDVMSDSIFIKTKNGFDKLIPHDTKAGTRGQYMYEPEELIKLTLFLYYGVDGDEVYTYKEIAGLFVDYNSKKGDQIKIEWELTADKIVKIYLDGKEIISTGNSQEKSSIIKDFKIL